RRSSGAPLRDHLANYQHEIDRHFHRSMGSRLVGGFVFGDGLLIRLRLVVLQNASNTFLVPANGVPWLLHCVLLRRRRSALSALAPSRYAVMTKTEVGNRIRHVDNAKVSADAARLPRPGPLRR